MNRSRYNCAYVERVMGYRGQTETKAFTKADIDREPDG
jgi:polyphosphate kinase 2 (PPK2 family)